MQYAQALEHLILTLGLHTGLYIHLLALKPIRKTRKNGLDATEILEHYQDTKAEDRVIRKALALPHHHKPSQSERVKVLLAEDEAHEKAVDSPGRR